MRGSFFCSDLNMEGNKYVMFDQEGIYVTYTVDPAALARILPPQMTPVATVAFAYMINIQKPTFACRYTEAALGIPVVCGGVQGVYWLSFLLGGPGAEMGTHLGREVIGIPKKIADEINIRRYGNYARASVTRHGIKIVDLEMDITGSYANAAANQVLGDPKTGSQQILPGIFYQYGYTATQEGKLDFFESSFRQLAFVIDWHGYEKGVARIQMQDSLDDPWAELAPIEVLGAGWIKNDIDLAWGKKIMDVDAAGMLPYVWNARYDAGPHGKKDIVFF